MGSYNISGRPSKIKLLNIENPHSSAFVTYEATYKDKSSQIIRADVKKLNTSKQYKHNPHIVSEELLGTVYTGLIKSQTRLIFIVTLSDFTVDIIQETEGSAECNAVLAKCVKEERGYSESLSEELEPAPTDRLVEDISIPIEVLPNLYAVRLSNVSLKHHLTYENGKKTFDYVTLKCKINYYLNGRKEGKRYIIFTSYDTQDRVIEIKGEHKKYTFTEAGSEFVEVCFSDYGNNPVSKIGISIKEV